ncbi:tRNA1(Val) (adenine(37)-N6)-methyltransferase [Fusobacterium sp. MFO224]|uniref:tRNA1(Val) (adenine(37)-N6)-methyltransferase n=1 Tax=Fusobacterium sp. MFO224 TaxID=3378070 RepID=UPI003852C173
MDTMDLTSFEDGTNIYQYKNGFRFSVDPLLLVDFFNGNPDKKILDIGSGCGIIPILLAKKKNMKNITGIEIQKKSFELFQKNLKENNLQDKVRTVLGDINNFKEGNSFDYIISNPPYMNLDGKKISDNENKKISRHEICLNLSSFAKNCKRLLKPRGEIFLVHRSFRFLEIVREFENLGLSISNVKFVYFNRASNSNLVLIQASKGRKCMPNFLPPLFLEENGY